MAIANAVCEAHDTQLGDKTALDSPRLLQAKMIDALSKGLGGKIGHFYVYGAIEGETLVFYLSHPAMLMEFKGKKADILNALRVIYKRERFKKSELYFTDIRAAVKNKPIEREERINIERDRSDGTFEIYGEGAVAAKFKQIAKTIREKNLRYEAQQKEGE